MQPATKSHLLKSILKTVYSPIYNHLINKTTLLLTTYNIQEVEYKSRLFAKYDHSYAYIKLFSICNYTLNTYVPIRLPRLTLTKEFKRELDSIIKLDEKYYEHALVYKAFILRILNNSLSCTDVIKLLPFKDSDSTKWFTQYELDSELTLTQEYIDKFKLDNKDLYEHHKVIKAHSLLLT